VDMSRSISGVLAEVFCAQDQYGDFKSTHEAYGVLAEEVAELLDAIRANNAEAIDIEATQVSAVALRLSHQCKIAMADASAFGERSKL